MKNKEELFIPYNEAEESKALIVMLMGVLFVLATILSVWLGFHMAERMRGAQPQPVSVKSDLTDSEIKALQIAKARSEKHAR